MPRVQPELRRRRRIIAMATAAGFLALSMVASLLILVFDSSSSGQPIQKDSLWDEITPESADVESRFVNVFYQLTGFDSERQTAEVTTYVWPSMDIATPFSSSTVADLDLSVFIDEVGGQGFYEFDAGQPIAGIETKIDATNPYSLTRSMDTYYPFDSYSLTLYTQVSERVPLGDDYDVVPLPAFEDTYSTAVPGFQVRLTKEHDESFFAIEPRSEDFPFVEKAIEQRMNGLVMTTAVISRNFSVKIIAVLVALYCLIIALSLGFMTLQILQRDRPPSMQVLIWAAANALGLIQVRDLLPGKPRIGISFDIIVYFPSLTATLCSTVALFIIWSYREDWKI
jgi:hypothetical protein